MDYTLYIYLFIHIVSAGQRLTLTCWKVRQRFSSSPWAAFFPFTILHLCSQPLQLSLMKSFSKPQNNYFSLLTVQISNVASGISAVTSKDPEFFCNMTHRKETWLTEERLVPVWHFNPQDWMTEPFKGRSESISDKMPQERRLYVHKCQWACVRKCAAVRKQPFLEQTLHRLLSIELGCAVVERRLCCWPL